jgi:hypothetical protein
MRGAQREIAPIFRSSHKDFCQDRDDPLRIVELRDSLKQRTAVQSSVHYLRHVENNSFLSKRVTAFFDRAGEAAETASPTDAVAIDEPSPETR